MKYRYFLQLPWPAPASARTMVNTTRAIALGTKKKRWWFLATQVSRPPFHWLLPATKELSKEEKARWKGKLSRTDIDHKAAHYPVCGMLVVSGKWPQSSNVLVCSSLLQRLCSLVMWMPLTFSVITLIAEQCYNYQTRHGDPCVVYFLPPLVK